MHLKVPKSTEVSGYVFFRSYPVWMGSVQRGGLKDVFESGVVERANIAALDLNMDTPMVEEV